MVYLYRKRIAQKDYYYLRASVKKNDKLVTKDIAYLGNDPTKLQEKLDELPQEYKKEIRKAYRTLRQFIESNKYEQEAKNLKPKQAGLGPDIVRVEACRLHWKKILELHQLTKGEVLRNFIIEFAFNTAAIEGNTITLREAQDLLVNERTPKNRTLREVYDLQNTERVFMEMFEKLPKITHKLIQDIHAKLLKDIDSRTGYRTEEVRVYKARFKSSPARYVKTDMDLLMQWLESNKKHHPLIIATGFHHKFEKIHPFMDGNGRTGRMLANLILLQNKYPPIIYRKKNRQAYLTALSEADKTDLEALGEEYRKLLQFTIKEYTESYWNIFL